LASFSILSTALGAAMYFHSYTFGGFLLPFGVIATVYILIL
jgi:hypothetical protein